MKAIIAFISQKGGVGKSTLSRCLAHEASQNKLHVLLADCDPQQATSYHWLQLRQKNKMTVKIFPTAQQALREAKQYELTIIDGPARTSHATLEIAQVADLVVQPTGTSIDDLLPAVKEFHALKEAGVRKDKLVFALNRIGTVSEAEIAKEYLTKAGYEVLPTYLSEKTSYRQAQNQGLAISEVTYLSLKNQAQSLIQEIIKKINKQDYE